MFSLTTTQSISLDKETDFTTTVIQDKPKESDGATTTTLLRGLDSKRPVRERSMIHVEIDYLSCPSLRAAVNILKKNYQGAVKLPADFEHEYDLVSISKKLPPPALLSPKTIYIHATKDGLYYETLKEDASSSGCDLLSMSSVPDAKNLNKLPIHSDAAYVRVWNPNNEDSSKTVDKLFYVNKATGECIEIKFNAEEQATKLDKFDITANARAKAATLTEEQLKTITSITGHTRSSYASTISWADLPENFPRITEKIIQGKSKNFSVILAQTLKADHTHSDFRKIILSIEDVEKLFDEFDIYYFKLLESEDYARTLAPNEETEAYLVQANKLIQSNKRTFERARVYLMERVLEQLEKETVKIGGLPTNNPEETLVSSYSTWRWAAFIMLMVVEFVPALWGNLMYASSSMASLTPYLFFIPPPVMAAIGIMSALSMLGGMICFIGPILMKWLKVNYSSPDTSLLPVYKQQLEITERIDNHLLNDKYQSSRTYQAYANFSKRMSAHLKTIVLPEKNKNLLTKITTVIMTALAGVQALSGSVLLAATILGCTLGAFTVATCSPVILTAFVASHIWSVLFLASPLALCQGVVSYILRICSTSELLDPATKEHDAVEKKRGDYVKNQCNTQQQLNELCLTGKNNEKMRAISSVSTRPYLAGIIEGVKLKKSPHEPTNSYLEQKKQALFLSRRR